MDDGVEKAFRIGEENAKVKVFGQFADEADRVQGLCMLRDDRSGTPYELVRSMESAFLEHRPHGTYWNAYVVYPLGCNAIRKRLFEMVITDPHRKESAFALLGQIEVWRLEHEPYPHPLMISSAY